MLPKHGGGLVTAQEFGPSYWDVSERLQHLRDVWGVNVEFTVVAPVRVGVDNRWSSWGVYPKVTRGALAVAGLPARVETFGKGGHWKTAPTAMFNALVQIETLLEDAERVARAQARF